jgi:hypothetical protein
MFTVDTRPRRGVVGELEYPEEWLIGWASILYRWLGATIDRRPGAFMDRRFDLKIYPTDDNRGLHGTYSSDTDGSATITLYPESDHCEALTTLLHELAHAWSEPVHIGKAHCQAWRAVYLDLFEYLTGIRIHARMAERWLRAHGARPTFGCRQDRFRANALDRAVRTQLCALDDAGLLSIEGSQTHIIAKAGVNAFKVQR